MQFIEIPKKINPKKQWFPVPDSLVKKTDGTRGRYYNVEARFEDHPILNRAKSEDARTQIYDTGIMLHTRVKLCASGRALPNMSAQPLRFDKGAALRNTDFMGCKALILRCWEAWQHYQTVRNAPVTELEAEALRQISKGPKPAKALSVPALALPVDESEEDEEEEYEEEAEEAPEAIIHAAPKPKGGRKSAHA